jgi:15-cis-phytoene desaturase
MGVDATNEAIVIGAGLAGLSAAIYLQEAGITPVVLERNTFIGGRTSSWVEDGMPVESGYHRYLGFYAEMPKLLKKAGLALDDILEWEDQVEIRVPNGPHSEFGASLIHKPIKTITRALGDNDVLSVKDKASLTAFVTTGLKDYVTRPEYLDSQTVQQYAERHGVTKDAIDRMLVSATEGLFFLTPRVYSAFAFFSLIAPYWKKLPAMRIGAFAGGMSEVMADPLANHIRKQGGRVQTGVTISKIRKTATGFSAETETGESFAAPLVILAASVFPAQEIIRRSFDDAWFNPMLALKTVSSVSFQIELSEPALPIDRTTFGPMTGLGSFTEQSRTTFKDLPGRLSIILTPPDRFIYMDADDIMQTVSDEAKTLGVDLAGKVVRYRKIVIPHDFYLMAPGAEKLRPAAKTPVPGFFLAGDYTRQKYLTTMEGAVYSGKIAAGLAATFGK